MVAAAGTMVKPRVWVLAEVGAGVDVVVEVGAGCPLKGEEDAVEVGEVVEMGFRVEGM